VGGAIGRERWTDMKKKSLLALTTAIVMISSLTTYAGQWKQENNTWWYQNDNGSYPANGWEQIDSNLYYFGEDGYLLTNTTTPDSYQVDGNGARINEKAAEFEHATTLYSNGNTYIVYYNNEITCSEGYKYKIHGAILNMEWIFMEVELLEKPNERTYNGDVSMEVTKNDETIDLNSWDAEFLNCGVKGNLSTLSRGAGNNDAMQYWYLCNTSNKYIESGNTIGIYIRGK